MKKALLIMVASLLMLVPFGLAQDTARGYVKIEITNSPPQIAQMERVPDTSYPDSEIDCTAQVEDEAPQKVSLKKKVMVNGEPYRGELEAGDNATCSITPVDLHGVEGQTKSISFTVEEPSASAKTMKTVLELMGASKSYSELETESKEVPAATGFVVKTGAVEGNLLPALLTLFLTVIGVLIGYDVKLRRRLQNS